MTPDYLKKQREEKAIKANLKIGGRFFCWHDFTSLGNIGINSNAVPFMCVKCGLPRTYTHSEASSYIENLFKY